MGAVFLKPAGGVDGIFHKKSHHSQNFVLTCIHSIGLCTLEGRKGGSGNTWKIQGERKQGGKRGRRGGEREEGGDKEGRKGGEKKEQGRVRDIN